MFAFRDATEVVRFCDHPIREARVSSVSGVCNAEVVAVGDLSFTGMVFLWQDEVLQVNEVEKTC